VLAYLDTTAPESQGFSEIQVVVKLIKGVGGNSRRVRRGNEIRLEIKCDDGGNLTVRANRGSGADADHCITFQLNHFLA
jgi:hypothetical protein